MIEKCKEPSQEPVDIFQANESVQSELKLFVNQLGRQMYFYFRDVISEHRI